jgi:superfamily II DNA/RNA helicase
MMTFAEIGVRPELVAALSKQHITEPTAIQIAALPVLLAGRDAYLNSETGTGKTLAYLLPIFSRLDLQREATQVVVIAPTHELAIQIQRQCTDLAQHAGWAVRTVLLIGGTATERQVDKLKKKPHVVVGSPGRIRELIGMRKLKMPAIGCIVIDEADRLLLKESLADVRAIIGAAPGRQLIFASATEQPESAEALASLAPDVTVLRTGAGPVNENIEHCYLVCEERDKPDVLRRLLHALPPGRAMVFVHRNETAENVAAKLAHHQIAVANLHAAADKRDRQQAMEAIRSGRVSVLIASDVAARGLDIAGIATVVNFDVPTQSKAYLHRVGRTARAGAKGRAMTLMTADELRLIPRFESELGIAMRHVRLREGRVIDAGEGVPGPRGPADHPSPRSLARRRA